MFSTPTSLIHTIYKGQTSNGGPSARLWSEIRSAGISPDGFAAGRYSGDDFNGWGLAIAVAGTTGKYCSGGQYYKSYEDTGDALTLAATSTGVIQAVIASTNNNETWIQSGDGIAALGAYSRTAGSEKLTVFETRFKLPTVTAGNVFIGLGQPGFAAANAIIDAPAVSTYTASDPFASGASALGIFVNEADPDLMTIIYKNAAGVPQVVGTYGNLTLDTFYNVGWAYNPAEENSKKIKFFVNNTEQTFYVTDTNMSASTFPNGVDLSFVAGGKNNNAAKTIACDWWHFWQAR